MGGYATFAFFEIGMLRIDLLPCRDIGAEMKRPAILPSR